MKIKPNKNFTITDGATLTLQLASDVETYYFSGTPTLSSNVSITVTGTPKEGMGCTAVFNTTITLNHNHVIVNGVQIPDGVAATPFWAFCVYANAGWHVVWIQKSSGTGGGIGIDADGNYVVNAKSLDHTHLSDTAAILFSQLVALTGHENLIPKIGADGFLTYSDVTTTVFEYIKNLSSDAQAQLTAIIGAAVTLAGRVTTNEGDITTLQGRATSVEGRATVLEGYRVTDAGNIAAIQATLAAGVTPKAISSSMINSATVLTSTTIKNYHDIDVTGGSVPLTLPKASTAPGFITTLTQYGTNTATINPNAADTILLNDMSTPSSITLGGTGKWITLTSDGVSQWKLRMKG